MTKTSDPIEITLASIGYAVTVEGCKVKFEESRPVCGLRTRFTLERRVDLNYTPGIWYLSEFDVSSGRLPASHVGQALRWCIETFGDNFAPYKGGMVLEGAATEPGAVNIRHNIDPTLVAEQIENKCQAHARQMACSIDTAHENCLAYDESTEDQRRRLRWSGAPTRPEQIRELYQQMIDKERAHFSTVRVIERPISDRAFILVYGDADDATVKDGTGGFDTFSAAAQWFLGGGR